MAMIVVEARSQRRHEGQRQDQRGEGQEDVGAAHQHRVHAPAEIARNSAEQVPDGPHHDGHEKHDRQRDARAMHEPREDAPTKIVGPEKMRRIRQLHGFLKVLQERLMSGDQRRENATRIDAPCSARPFGRRLSKRMSRGGHWGNPIPSYTHQRSNCISPFFKRRSPRVGSPRAEPAGTTVSAHLMDKPGATCHT
ncbi:MAG: hypothetical protein GYB50_13300 [Rhodobacteraceae bacterium]|nr:hypothetical protein [Paracoccaceae bacterium]